MTRDPPVFSSLILILHSPTTHYCTFCCCLLLDLSTKAGLKLRFLYVQGTFYTSWAISWVFGYLHIHQRNEYPYSSQACAMMCVFGRRPERPAQVCLLPMTYSHFLHWPHPDLKNFTSIDCLCVWLCVLCFVCAMVWVCVRGWYSGTRALLL